jgi:hypothetical protein
LTIFLFAIIYLLSLRPRRQSELDALGIGQDSKRLRQYPARPICGGEIATDRNCNDCCVPLLRQNPLYACDRRNDAAFFTFQVFRHSGTSRRELLRLVSP